MKYSATTATKRLFQLSAISLALTLAGCGGGDDAGGDTLGPKPCLGYGCNGGGDTGGGDTGDTGGQVVEDAISMTPLIVYDENGQITRKITEDGATVSVTVTDDNGVPISGALVTFSGEGVKFGSSNSATITGEDGKAELSIKPSDPNDTGSYPISATASYQGLTASTQQYNISVKSTDSNGGVVFDDPVNLTPLVVYGKDGEITRFITSQGATASVTVTDDNGNPISGALVTFASEGLVFRSSNGSVVSDEDGIASIDVLPLNNNDRGAYSLTATASYQGETATETSNISVLPDVPQAGDSIYEVYVSPSKAALLTGTDEMVLTVRVINTGGGIMPNVPVKIGIEEASKYGLSLKGSSEQMTDDQGLVTIGINQSNIGINSQLDHSTNVVVTVDDGVNNTVTQTLPITVTGTEVVDVVTSASIIKEGTTANITGRLLNGSGDAIANTTVELVGAATTNMTTTNSAGEFEFENVGFNSQDVNSNNQYVLDLVVNPNATGNKISQTFSNIASLTRPAMDNIIVEYGNEGDQSIAVQTKGQITVTIPDALRDPNVNEVTISTTRGVFDNGQSRRTLPLNSNGEAVFEIISGTPGIATIETRYGSTEAINTLPFVAVEPAKILVQAETNLLAPNTSTQIIARVLDVNDAAIPNALVEFAITKDASGGRLSRASVSTDNSGVATVTYTAGGNPTPISEVIISSRVVGVQRPGESNLTVSNFYKNEDEARLTVQTSASTIAFGFADKVRAGSSNVYYFWRGSAFVTTNGSLPAANQQVTLTLRPKFYHKGFWVKAETDEGTTTWVQMSYDPDEIEPAPKDLPPAGDNNTIPGSKRCYNEDINYNSILDNDANEDINNNGILDLGEDFNDNGQLDESVKEDINNNNKLEPGFSATLLIDGQAVSANNGVYNLRTDEDGRIDFELRYLKEYASWFDMQMFAVTAVNGSEFKAERVIGFPVLADDVTDDRRPDIISPFGEVADCTDPR